MHERLVARASIFALGLAGCIWSFSPALGQDVFADTAASSAKKAAPAKAVAPAKAAPPASGAGGHSVPASKSHTATAGHGPAHAGGVPHSERVAAPPLASPGAVRAYCGKLWNKIQNNWELASGKNHVVLGVDVDGGGNVFATKVTSTPQNGDAEAKAQAALTKSQPLDPLPAGLPSAHLTVTFDSTADPHGDSNSNGSVRLEYHPGSNPNMDNSSHPAESSKAEPEKESTAGSGSAPANAGAAQPAGAPQSPAGQTPAH